MKDRTTAAFDAYRVEYGPQRPPRTDSVKRYADDCLPMNFEDGLCELKDGPIAENVPSPTAPPLDFSMNMSDKNIWAVRATDVVYVQENCPFGKARDAGVVKHTNLTGGGSAFAGGEMRFLQADSIIVNGCSGRYPVRSEDEMRSIGRAFLKSGYHVWCMGYDHEAGVSYPLGSVDSEWLG